MIYPMVLRINGYERVFGVVRHDDYRRTLNHRFGLPILLNGLPVTPIDPTIIWLAYRVPEHY